MNAEKIGNINAGDRRFEMTTENTSLWRHLGHLAIFDHVYVQLNEKEAIYLWESIDQTKEAYNLVAPVVVQKGGEIYLNLRKVASDDVKAYEHAATHDLGDGVPESWFE